MMANNDNDQIIMKLDKGELQKLHKSIKSQVRHLISKVERLQEQSLEQLLRYSRGLQRDKKNQDVVAEVAELAQELRRAENFLGPLQKKEAVLDALLDPQTSMWLNVEAGNRGDIVDEFIAEALNTDPSKLAVVEESPPEAEEKPKPKKKKPEKSKHQAKNPPEPKHFGSSLDEEE